jgi:hypothetical protein
MRCVLDDVEERRLHGALTMPTKRYTSTAATVDIEAALARFRSFCRFEPETGCVLWTGGTTSGRGHSVLYGSFWYDTRRWFAHRWSAKFIHGLEIDGLQVDHKCPHITIPNTLCVEHVQALTLGENRELQTIRAFAARKQAIHVEVGLTKYEDVYGPMWEPTPDLVPFYSPPAWLGATNDRPRPDRNACPF